MDEIKMQLTLVTTDFRKLMVEKIKTFKHPEFINFPSGSCFASSVLLNHFLINKGYLGFNIVFANLNNKSHSWVQNDQFIIDVTANQFDEIQEEVLVVRKGMDFWHRNFSVKSIRKTDYRDLVDLNLIPLGRSMGLLF
ncbi:hypothetical protein KZP23_21995 [Echinicola marina]|uniref:hypothetical protein n=1 Tax=Echinicola marina TaxID=2859768 RepID=UPI001CF66365|nr:hypothetical protein [Echinicola marina]UCS93286.1 hypothetical protein KZP23_21995 [Echinicola marina]